MKMVVLADGNGVQFANMSEHIGNLKYSVADTHKCDELQEIDFISSEIKRFSASLQELLFVRFSGRDRVAQEVGDETGELCVVITENKKSKYHTNEKPIPLFLKILQLFKRGD